MEEPTKNTLPENSFLIEEGHELQKLAYYGKFLVLSDFDDGWKYQMEKQLLDYLVSLDFSEEESKININIEQKIEEEKGEIFAILKAESLNTETENKILEVSTNLQKRFFMTPVIQKVGFGLSKYSNVKIELENLEQEDIGYERSKYQEVYAEIIGLNDDLKSNKYQINIYKNIDDEITKALIVQLNNNINIIESAIASKEEELKNLVPRLYQTLALKKDNIPTQEISKFQADGIMNLSGGNEGSKDILKLLEGIEELFKSNLEENEKHRKQIEELLDFKGVETGKVTEGLLTATKKDAGYLTKAKILDAKNSNIYLHDGKINNFKIDGLDNEISRIKILEEKNGIVTIFIAELLNGNKILYKSYGEKYIPLGFGSNKEFKDFKNQMSGGENNCDYYSGGVGTEINGSNFYYYIHNGKFEILEIEGEIYFNRFNNIHFSDDGKINSGEIIVDDDTENYFYLKNGEYQYLEIDHEKDFKSFGQFTYSGEELSSGEVVLSNNEKKYFYKDGLEFTLLNMNNGEEYDSYQDVRFNEKGIPLSYAVELENGSYSIYSIKGKFHTPLKLEGKTEFTNYKKLNYLDNKIINGWIKEGNGYKYFYLEEGKYKILEIEGRKVFEDFLSFRYNNEGKITLGIVNSGINEYSYFYLEDGEFKFLNISGDKVFYDIDIDTDASLNIQGGRVVKTKKDWKYKKKYKFYLNDGEFKYKKTLYGTKKNVW